MPINTKIQIRKGSASEWVDANTILDIGEPGYETDTGRTKIGNGSTPWNELQYISVVPSGFIAASGINIDLGTNGSTASISVSGIIANPSDNRILTSRDSTTTGIDAESNLTFDGSTFNIDGNIVFDSFTESVVSIGDSSTSQTLSLSSGTVQTCTLTGNCTFTMPTATAGKSFTMFLNSGSGNYVASFSGVLWSDSAPPTITTMASKVDILSFISDGTYWYGSYSQNYG